MLVKIDNTITFIDIDDTTFRTKTNVIVKDNNDNIVKVLDSYEYNNYKLKNNEHYDFSEFQSSVLFYDTAEIIPTVLRKINQILKMIRLKNGYDKIIFLTARSDMDDKKLFLKVFKYYGIPVDEKNIVYIERAGNINKPTPEAKKEIIDKYISNHRYQFVRMIDDSLANLDSFLKLKKDYPDLNFIAITVDKEGKLFTYKK